MKHFFLFSFLLSFCLIPSLAWAGHGQCGPAQGQMFPSAPTADLCYDGSTPIVADSGSFWTWPCVSWASTAYCWATKPLTVDATCGPAAQIYYGSEVTDFSGALCSSGTADPANPVFPGLGDLSLWKCIGSNPGDTADCWAYHEDTRLLVCPVTNPLFDSVTKRGQLSARYFMGSNGTETCSTAGYWNVTNSSSWLSSDINVVAGRFWPTPPNISAGQIKAIHSGSATITAVYEHAPGSLAVTVDQASCGANADTFENGESAFPSSDFCSLGTLLGTTPNFPSPGNPSFWLCQGLVDTQSCYASQKYPPVLAVCPKTDASNPRPLFQSSTVQFSARYFPENAILIASPCDWMSGFSNVTEDSDWNISSGTSVSLSNASGSKGEVKGIAAGDSKIGATYHDTALNKDFSDSAFVQVQIPPVFCYECNVSSKSCYSVGQASPCDSAAGQYVTESSCRRSCGWRGWQEVLP